MNDNIGQNKYPKQSEFVGKKVKVIFKYDKSVVCLGTMVRSDIEEPFKTIILLDDGRYITDDECQYSYF